MKKDKSVFISYSSYDREIVQDIVKVLEEEKIAYWVAPEMIPAGSSYAREIPHAIKQCDVFLLVLSKTSQNSIWVEKETDSAISHRKYIIPFQIDDVPLNDTFRFYLNNVQMISGTLSMKEALNELRLYLNHLIKEGLQNNDSKSGEQYNADSSESLTATMSPKSKGQVLNTTINGSFVKELQPQKLKRSYTKNSDSNALRINRIPLECDYCGSKHIQNVTMGTYRCERCGQDSYDDYQTIRNYLDKVGNATAAIIEQNTGVPKRVIEYFFRDEYLEIPKNSPVRVPCEACGSPIRTGTLCEKCKQSGQHTQKGGNRGRWHSLY